MDIRSLILVLFASLPAAAAQSTIRASQARHSIHAGAARRAR